MLDEVFRESHVDGHYTRKIQKQNKNIYREGAKYAKDVKKTIRDLFKLY